MWGVSLKFRKSCKEMKQEVEIDIVVHIVRRNRSQWFGLVARKNDDGWVKACLRGWMFLVREVEVDETTWKEYVWANGV